MGDTVWCADVSRAIEKFNPEILVSNCGEARFASGRPITMNAKDILSACKKAPQSRLVAVHMEAWNHCRLSRKELRDYVKYYDLEKQVYIPEDGEVLEF